MPELVALELSGLAFVDAVRRVWDRGDAFAPIDGRLPAGERTAVLRALAPTRVLGADLVERPCEGGRPVDDGDALVIATSGTTGHPKAVVHTHASVRASAAATSDALHVDPTRDRWLACLPLAHIGGLAVVLRALLTHTPLVVHDRFHPHAFADALDEGVTLTSLVTRALRQVPVPRLRAILLGGAAPPADRPANVIATYGMTETGSGVVYERQPLAGVELRIDDAGELCVRAPMLARAYRDGSAIAGADGWFATGDLAAFADDGRLVIHGRKGDVIVTGGEKVWPERVEAVIAALPGVLDVAVVGRAHAEWGHEVVAVIVPAADGDVPSLDDVRGAVRAQLPAWCAPRALVPVPQLPRTALGKLRRALVELPGGGAPGSS